MIDPACGQQVFTLIYRFILGPRSALAVDRAQSGMLANVRGINCRRYTVSAAGRVKGWAGARVSGIEKGRQAAVIQLPDMASARTFA